MIKRNFFYPAVVFAAFMAFQSVSALPFNKNLDKEELEKIEKGEILIRRTGSVKKMCLQTENVKVKEALKEIVDLDPAYLAEVIQVRPVSENENILICLQSVKLIWIFLLFMKMIFICTKV